MITVHAGKKKPSPGARVAPPLPAARDGCPETSWGRAGRSRPRRSPPKSKPMPVRQRVMVKREAESDFLCPESWRGEPKSRVLDGPRRLEGPGRSRGHPLH